ncbi:MAG: transposase, partial [Bacteroidota bacterium]
YYAKRWEIEVLFGDLKKRGFNFEDTHITQPQRINNLIAVLALAHVWAILVGKWILQKTKSIPIKKHGRKAISIFNTRTQLSNCQSSQKQ